MYDDPGGRGGLHMTWTCPRTHAVAAVAMVIAMAASCLGCSNDSASTSEFCSKVAAADQLLRQSDASKLADEAKAFDELRAVAPPEITDDIDLLADVVDDLAATVPSAASPEAGREAVFTRRADDRERIEVAGRNVERYTQENCGIALNPTSNNSVTGTAPSPGAGEAPGTTK